MDDVSQRFRDALIAGFRPYVAAQVGDVAGLEAAVEEGHAHLVAGLDELLALPSGDQRATPLQVFRSALEPVAAALAAAGQTAAGQGGEPGGLGPASAADVSPEALEASLAWGVTKAAAMARPLMVVVTSNLMDVGPFEAAAARVGYRVERIDADDMDGEMGAGVAFVDLESPGADRAIEAFAGAGVRTIAYGPHVDSFAMTRARTLGATAAEPRSRVLRDPSAFVSPVV